MLWCWPPKFARLTLVFISLGSSLLSVGLSIGLLGAGLCLRRSLCCAVCLAFPVALLVVLHFHGTELLAVAQELANQKPLGINRAALLDDQNAQQAVGDDEQYDQDREE